MINKAIIFATTVHGNQKRKGTDIPYILHPLEAGVIAAQIKYNKDIICAAILHDTVEDAHVTYETLEEMFNKRIVELVKAQSEDKSKPWKERKGHTIEYLASTRDEGIKIVALADKLSNIRAIYRDFAVIGDELWQRFNVKDKKLHKWHYEGLVKSLESLRKYREYQEFKELVSKVFG